MKKKDLTTISSRENIYRKFMSRGEKRFKGLEKLMGEVGVEIIKGREVKNIILDTTFFVHIAAHLVKIGINYVYVD